YAIHPRRGAEFHPHGVQRDVSRHVLPVKRPAAPATPPALPRGPTLVGFRILFGEFTLLPLLFAHVFGEHPNYHERLPVHIDGLADRNDLLPGIHRRPEKFVTNSGPDHD